MNPVRFITDLGSTAVLVSTMDTASEAPIEIGRYGVWEARGDKAECIACGGDLEALQAEYGPNLKVKKLS